MNNPGVLYIWRHKGRQTRIANADVARIDNAGGRIGRRDIEIVIAAHEVGIADIGRGGNKPADINARALAKHHPVGVNQHHRAIGSNGAKNRRGVIANHPV